MPKARVASAAIDDIRYFCNTGQQHAVVAELSRDEPRLLVTLSVVQQLDGLKQLCNLINLSLWVQDARCVALTSFRSDITLLLQSRRPADVQTFARPILLLG